MFRFLDTSVPEQMKYDFLAEAASHLMQTNDPSISPGKKASRRDAQPALENADQRGLGHSPTSVLQRKISRCIYVCTACRYNVIDETKLVLSKTVIWLCRFPKHSNIEVLTGAESGKTACLVSIQELLTA